MGNSNLSYECSKWRITSINVLKFAQLSTVKQFSFLIRNKNHFYGIVCLNKFIGCCHSQVPLARSKYPLCLSTC